MNTNTRKHLRCSTAALSLIALSTAASAVPINGLYLEDNRCDTVPTQGLLHELGNAAIFPPNESIIYQVTPAPSTVCVADDLIHNDWLVRMTNVSGVPWTNLFFVGDLGTKVGNADGNMIDVVNAPGVTTDAFRIDGTTTITGMNDNLLSESGVVNEIFEPGETWVFNVSNFVDAFGTNQMPNFLTPGQFAGSALPNTTGSNASILAVAVPEPTTVGVLGLVATALLMRRRRRA